MDIFRSDIDRVLLGQLDVSSDSNITLTPVVHSLFIGVVSFDCTLRVVHFKIIMNVSK